MRKLSKTGRNEVTIREIKEVVRIERQGDEDLVDLLFAKHVDSLVDRLGFTQLAFGRNARDTRRALKNTLPPPPWKL